jgi:hypothetical protein
VPQDAISHRLEPLDFHSGDFQADAVEVAHRCGLRPKWVSELAQKTTENLAVTAGWAPKLHAKKKGFLWH